MTERKQRNSENSLIIREGFLVKRGHVRHNWKTRWFRLSDSSLRYYKRQNDRVPQGRIPLRNAKLSIYHSDHKDDKGREFVMNVETSEGVQYLIQAPSGEDLKIWMECITDVIEHMQLENEQLYSPKKSLSATPSPRSTSPFKQHGGLGSLFDSYGGIKRRSRIVRGVRYTDGFTGSGLRKWMNETMGLGGSEADTTVTSLLNAGILELIDGDPDDDPFSNTKYYLLRNDEDSLKALTGEGDNTDETADELQDEQDRYDSNTDVFSSVENIDTSSAVLPSDLPPGEVVKRGILFKRGHVVLSWKPRCFVLQRFPATLSYFDPAKKNPSVLKVLSLHGATVFSVGKMAAQAALGIKNAPDLLFCVKISSGTLYIILASSDEERCGWIEAIKPLCRKMRSMQRDSAPPLDF